MKTNELEPKGRNELQYALHFSESDVKLSHSIFGTLISMEDCVPGGELGEPSLPVKIVRVALPVGTCYVDFKVNAVKQKTLMKEKIFVAPVQPAEIGAKSTGASSSGKNVVFGLSDNLKLLKPQQLTMDRIKQLRKSDITRKVVKFERQAVVPSEEAYQRILSKPEPVVSFVKVENAGLFQIAVFKVKPIEWKKDLTLSLTSSLEISVNYTFVKEQSKQNKRAPQNDFIDINQTVTDSQFQPELMTQFASPVRAQRAGDLFRDLVINPELIIDLKPFWPIFYGPAEYLIITDNNRWDAQNITPSGAITGDQVAEFQKIVHWKQLKGLTARLVTITDIVNNVYGDFKTNSRDLQEVIRKFLKWAHGSWGVSWLLLGGDTQIVPTRIVAGNTCGEFEAVTDTKPKAGKMKREANYVKLNVNGWNIMANGTPLLNHTTGQIIPFDNAGTAPTGWYFTTNDSYNVRSNIATNFVRVNGNNSVVNARLRWLRNENLIPTDYYYANISSTTPGTKDWDVNNNNLYGQAIDATDIDGVGTLADISVGRIPTDNATDAETFVKKLMAYEQLRHPDTKVALDTTWLKKILYLSDNWGGKMWFAPKTGANLANGQFEYKATINRTVLQSEKPVSFQDWRLTSVMPGDTFAEVPYNPDAATTNTNGWYFANDGDFSNPSEFHFSLPYPFNIDIRFPIPTRWVVVKSSAAIMQPTGFLFNEYGLDGSAADQEQLREQITGDFSHYDMIDRLYDDGPDLSVAQKAAAPLQPLTETNLVNRINQGQHIISMSGHGWWGGCCGFKPTVGQNAANGYKLFIGYADSCLTNQFDEPDAISETLLKNPNGGVIAYIGSSRYSWIGVGDNFQRKIFKRLKTTRHLGLAFDMRTTLLNENTGFWSLYNNWTIFALNLIGDPEMGVWRNEPGLLAVKYARPAYGATSLKVNVKDLNTRVPLSNVVVSIVQNNKIIKQQRTDSVGNVTLKITKTNNQAFELVAVLPEYKPEFSTVNFLHRWIKVEDVIINNVHLDQDGINHQVEVVRLDNSGQELIENIKLPASVELNQKLIDSLVQAKEQSTAVNLTLDVDRNLLKEVHLQ